MVLSWESLRANREVVDSGICCTITIAMGTAGIPVNMSKITLGPPVEEPIMRIFIKCTALIQHSYVIINQRDEVFRFKRFGNIVKNIFFQVIKGSIRNILGSEHGNY